MSKKSKKYNKYKEYRTSERSIGLSDRLRSLRPNRGFPRSTDFSVRQKYGFPDHRRTYGTIYSDRRLPILGLQSQVKKVNKKILSDSLGESLREQMHQVSDRLKKIMGVPNTCRNRSIKRSVLFSIKVAGPGRRRSPGAGGHYKRREESNQTC